MMPLDNSLNQDAHEGVKQHVCLSASLGKAIPGEKQPKAGTPNNLLSCYLQVWEGCPSIEHTNEDVERFIAATKAIFGAQGIAIRCFGRRDGRRAIGAATYEGWGGHHPKSDAAEEFGWLHSHIADIKAELVKAAGSLQSK